MIKTKFSTIIVVAIAIAFLSPYVSAQMLMPLKDAKSAEAPIDEKELFTIPDGTPEVMLGHFKKITDALQKQDFQSRDEQIDFVKKSASVALEIGNKVLKADATDEEKNQAYTLKAQGYMVMAQMEENDLDDDGNPKSDKYKKEFASFVEELSKLDDENLSMTGMMFLFRNKMSAIAESDDFEKSMKSVRDEIVDVLKKNKNEKAFILPLQFLMVIDMFAPEKETVAILKDCVKTFEPFMEGADPQFKEMFKSVVGQAEEYEKDRGAMLGKEIKLDGVNLNGEDFDIQSLKGKVVLIDFWATWCPPCVAEVPNMKKLYKKYKDDGFEIVGYSIDDDLDALKSFTESEKTPWIVISQAMSVEKGKTDYSEVYKIEAIPAMFLLDKDGKVVSTKARGPILERLLKDIFKK